MSRALTARAPAKVNLGLFLGPARADGRHELVTVYEALSLADTLTAAPLAGDSGAPSDCGASGGSGAPDRVHCAGVEGPNLAATALCALRAAGWRGPPLALQIDKRIPVAAGMAGGSADAAAALRLALAFSPAPPELDLRVLAARLGADVPAQLTPGLWLGTGTGEVLRPLAPLAPHAFVIVPSATGLATADVYGEADRLGLGRSAAELQAAAGRLGASEREAQPGPELLINDLEPAAISLLPEIDVVMAAVRQAGADHTLLCGSGPTVAGVFWEPFSPSDSAAAERAGAAAAALSRRWPGATSEVPVAAAFGEPRAVH